MSTIWDQIKDLGKEIESRFQQSGEQYQDLHCEYDWYNKLYKSLKYRRAHIEIVDKTVSNGIYILHSTVFPHYHDNSPIWGFDIICGKNKITGAFHDFSSAGDPDHSMMKWFATYTENLSWSKPRQLPEWARQIFSNSMIAAGNIQDLEEIELLCSTAINTLDYYLDNVGITQQSFCDFHMAQNRYCYYQKQNPQVINSMVAMGIPESTIRKFVDTVLFPEAESVKLV